MEFLFGERVSIKRNACYKTSFFFNFVFKRLKFRIFLFQNHDGYENIVDDV